MAKIRIFVVFHQNLDERLIFGELTESEVERWFIAYGVNIERQPKRVTYKNGSADDCSIANRRLILEYQLQRYHPELQARGFMETSCYVHVEENGLYAGADVVGVCQYDSRWTADAVEVLRALSNAPDAGRATFGTAVGSIIDRGGAAHPLAYADQLNWPFLLDSYNRFFGTRWGMEVLVGKPLTLFQTYLLPAEEFVALARWLKRLCSEVYPWAKQPPYPTHWGSLGGYTERAEALFMAARMHEGRLNFRWLSVINDEDVGNALGITKEH